MFILLPDQSHILIQSPYESATLHQWAPSKDSRLLQAHPDHRVHEITAVNLSSLASVIVTAKLLNQRGAFV